VSSLGLGWREIAWQASSVHGVVTAAVQCGGGVAPAAASLGGASAGTASRSFGPLP